MQNQPTSQDPEWTIIKLIGWTTSYFKSHDIESPRITAEILLAHVLNFDRIDLYLRYDQPLNDKELGLFKMLIKRRINREPVAYIVGTKEFWSMDLAVTPEVLIPRPETECLVEAALDFLPDNSVMKPKRVLELGTGSGAVILALASTRPNHLFFASDRSLNAVKLARKNARHHGLDTRVNFFCADWFSPLHASTLPFDVIISNPPYIPTKVIAQLQPEISRYEPTAAIDGQEDGLGCLRLIISNAHRYLKKKGRLLLEMGHDQRTPIQKIIESCAVYEDIIFTKDYGGYDRIVQMQKKSCG